MSSRRIFGYLLIAIGILFTLGIIAQIPQLFRILAGIVLLFTGKLDAFTTGEVLGGVLFWIVYFGMTYMIWKYGLRWSKKKVVLNNSETE